MRIQYLILTHQIQTITQFDIVIDPAVIRLHPTLSAKYAALKDSISAIIEYIKHKGFSLIEDYSLEDPLGCFDSDEVLICSICLDEITNPKATLVLCPHCKEYVGHMLCVSKWLKTGNSCPLCRK